MTASRLVVDASIVAKAYLKDESYGDIAVGLLNDFAAGAVDLLAPELILYEVPSAIQKAVRQRRIDAGAAQRAVDGFLDLGIVTVGDARTLPELISLAYRTSQRVGCRIYDALYLVVAEALNTSFLTADRRLHDMARSEYANLLWIEDYVAGGDTRP